MGGGTVADGGVGLRRLEGYCFSCGWLMGRE